MNMNTDTDMMHMNMDMDHRHDLDMNMHVSEIKIGSIGFFRLKLKLKRALRFSRKWKLSDISFQEIFRYCKNPELCKNVGFLRVFVKTITENFNFTKIWKFCGLCFPNIVDCLVLAVMSLLGPLQADLSAGYPGCPVRLSCPWCSVPTVQYGHDPASVALYQLCSRRPILPFLFWL